jgi:hypothetical protein
LAGVGVPAVLMVFPVMRWKVDPMSVSKRCGGRAAGKKKPPCGGFGKFSGWRTSLGDQTKTFPGLIVMKAFPGFLLEAFVL